jgi:hypothetical protein
VSRKQYFQLIKKRVDALREDRKKMHRIGSSPPTIAELGDVFAHVYTTIESEPNSPVRHAFRECKLKLDNPFHWADLLRALCDLNFSSKQSANPKRTSVFLAQLRRDRVHVLKKDSSASQTKQAQMMKAEFPDQYGGYKIASIRRLFSVKAKRQAPPKRLILFRKLPRLRDLG